MNLLVARNCIVVSGNSMVFVASGYSDTDMIVLRVTVPIG